MDKLTLMRNKLKQHESKEMGKEMTPKDEAMAARMTAMKKKIKK